MAINPKILNEGEHVIISTRTHPKALIVPGLILLLILVVAIFSDRTFVGGAFSWGMWVVAVGLILWLSVWPLLEWLSASYTITNRRLITRRGVLVRRGHDIPLSRISDVAYELGVVDRMLGCGTLIISDASTLGRVPLHDIPHVEETQRRLNDLLHDLGESPRADDGS
ncbi:MAG: PH domain-containing protein [Nocardioides sp.]|uniref:PH domain-containing protein n=1 Tax=Nocardioides sp. TaxID=35761 RepID=UPI0039E49BF4